MSWVALHTSQSIEPHCTLAWWPDAETHTMEAQLIIGRLRDRFPGNVIAWVDHHEFFGARQDLEVAVLDHSAVIEEMMNELAPLHDSEFPQRPHVTVHQGRQTFTFQWLGLHVPNLSIYWKLDTTPVSRGRGNRKANDE